MRELHYRLCGEAVSIRIPETDADLTQFSDWIDANNRRRIGLDTETTGLDIYSAGYRLRTVQFGTEREGWVLLVENGPRFLEVARKAVLSLLNPIIQNASFDIQVLEHHLAVPSVQLWPRVTDTRILAHLVDPRGEEEGGTGHSLEALVKRYVDPNAGEEVKGLPAKLATRYKTSKDKIWAVPEVVDDPEYLLYAGMDPVFTMRLHSAVEPLVPGESRHLIAYEHEVARVCSAMERTGFLLDVTYTEQLADELRAQEEEATLHALAFFGIHSVNATEEVAEVLWELGVQIPERTPTGKRKVDKVLLGKLAEDVPELGSVGHLVAAVTEAKKARKWRKTWLQSFLEGRDPGDRVHPSIHPLRARTARMSISTIPAQTLPSGDPTIRRCFIAEPGRSIVSVDYAAQELRVLAALSGDPTMRQAFAEGADLHQLTAEAAGVVRQVGKTTNFLQVYGGGASTLAEKADIDMATAKQVFAAFARTYPQVAVFAKRLSKIAVQQGYITTRTGRRLPVDRSRPYSALNYMIQSTSRDVTCRGLLALDNAGFTPYLRLPVHDEVIASVPAEHAEYGAREIARHLRMELEGVLIDTDADVYGPSWGHGYMTKAA
ncbi:DNA polymerase [Nocardia brasiliensis]|uniref:DNA polymerase n=1 Tax=Nocardia brasiliensis TaxID=37326 RepID=UPI00366B778F